MSQTNKSALYAYSYKVKISIIAANADVIKSEEPSCQTELLNVGKLQISTQQTMSQQLLCSRRNEFKRLLTGC